MMIIEIEREAEKVLSALKIKSMPVPVEEIASYFKIRISRAPSKDFSGLLIRKDGSALIGVNSTEALVRQRFTIAHELGHFFLHPQKDTFVDYRDNKKEAMRTPRERQANMFAAALLMPRSLLEKDFRSFAKKGFTEIELQIFAEKYQVSEDAMRIRLINLNLKA
ncbi:MAG: ImmA/IrrE family metallo-endopeptidase [bacterium]|nr:ImmA/IrrE family metallo-endopeptidase [bacterium]